MIKYKVWWKTAAYIEPFEIEVSSIMEAALILKTLSDYEEYQIHHDLVDIMKDMACGNLLCKHDGDKEWVTWKIADKTLDDIMQDAASPRDVFEREYSGCNLEFIYNFLHGGFNSESL